MKANLRLVLHIVDLEVVFHALEPVIFPDFSVLEPNHAFFSLRESCYNNASYLMLSETSFQTLSVNTLIELFYLADTCLLH